jgi:peptidyl-prolyl cis-trans isomerase D
MSVIQKIRDKYAAAAIATIAIAMVGFILIDALSQRGGGSVFSKDINTLGKVNGEKVSRIDFENQIKRAEERYQQQGLTVNEDVREEINNSLWGSIVERELLNQQADKLGLTFTDKELETLIYGPNPPEAFRQQRFMNPQTGQYDPSLVADYIKRVKRMSDTSQEKQGLEDYLYNQISNQALREKYLILLMGASYYPKWLAEKDNQDNSAIASISYTGVPYAIIADSSVPVSESQINDYIAAHKEEFSTTEATRNINYVIFDADASAKDSANILSGLLALKSGFIDTKDAQGYLNQNGSSISFYDGYVGKSVMQNPNKDSILSLPIGGTFGPYLDGQAGNANYVIAKMIDKKEFADSVKARWIIIPNQTQAGEIPDSIVKAKGDSIAAVAQKGGDFKALAASIDGQNPEAGKEYTIAYNQAYSMTNQNDFPKELSDFMFNGKTGDKKLVKIPTGYIYTEILDQKNVEPYYKVAYLAKDIQPSDETTTAANTAATSFAADAQGKGQFDETARDHKVVVRTASVKETDYQIPGIGQARRMVKWAFDAKKGAIGDPESFGNKFVVATLEGIQDAGVPSGSYARTLVENSVRRDLKTKQIVEKLGAVSDLSAVASKYPNASVMHADSVGFASSMVPQVGNEPRLVGAVFYKGNLNKVSSPIEGNSGVFLVKTESVTSVPNQNNTYQLLRQNMEGNMRNNVGYHALEGLKTAAKIEDDRLTFYGN